MKTCSGEGEEKLLRGIKLCYKALSLNSMVLVQEQAIRSMDKIKPSEIDPTTCNDLVYNKNGISIPPGQTCCLIHSVRITG